MLHPDSVNVCFNESPSSILPCHKRCSTDHKCILKVASFWLVNFCNLPSFQKLWLESCIISHLLSSLCAKLHWKMDFWHVRLSLLSHGRLYAPVHSLQKAILEGLGRVVAVRGLNQVLPLQQVFGHCCPCNCTYNSVEAVDTPSPPLSISPLPSITICIRFS